MIIKVNRDIYSKSALIKAAYQFTDTAYVFLDLDDIRYVVDITYKNGGNEEKLVNDFKNELLIQSARQVVFQQTKEIRELLMARAFASTVVYSSEDTAICDKTDVDESLDSILTDWFEKYDKK